MRVRAWMWGVVLTMGMSAGCAAGQQRGASGVAAPATSLAGVLRSLASRSGVVFVGQVQSIVPNGGVVEITFQVQQAVLGNLGATYVMREWAGRWTGGRQRYRVGERGMFFLHAPGVAGLSSPVDGMTGVVPLVTAGANAAAMLDVRWLSARVVRSVGSPMAGSEAGAMALTDATTVVSGWQKTAVPEPVGHPLPVLYPLPGGVEFGGPVLAQPTESKRVEMMNVPLTLQSQEAADVQR